MKNNIIVKREDGTQYNIDVSIGIDHSTVYFDICVTYRKKGKRSWLHIPTIGTHEYRRLSMDDRRKHTYQTCLKYVTDDEIKQCIDKLTSNINDEISNQRKELT